MHKIDLQTDGAQKIDKLQVAHPVVQEQTVEAPIESVAAPTERKVVKTTKNGKKVIQKVKTQPAPKKGD